MLRLGWLMSAELAPGAIIFSLRMLPGCFPGLLHVGTLLAPTSWSADGSEVLMYVVTPAPIIPQPFWLVPTEVKAESVLSALKGSPISRTQWADACTTVWPESREVMLWRLLGAGAAAFGRPDDEAASGSFPHAAVALVLQERSRGHPGQSAVDCAWKALVVAAAAHAGLINGISRTDADLGPGAVVARLGNVSAIDVDGRSLASFTDGARPGSLEALVLASLRKADAVPNTSHPELSQRLRGQAAASQDADVDGVREL
eukprot:gnl/TRDRNA2_/TRDRNA2_94178_c0_seq1.p1 gnl/TRDRNA2_/TRDRNA2_94178_c0~~gnl/TRDRNA2_/TRDRNA2_94178_c0_seq1.p1  ORF type:complete len:259 (-),score=49.09 gnl/TRDRNA2_/TRDRNA2_94178_c0_seq1:672-1448(-)